MVTAIIPPIQQGLNWPPVGYNPLTDAGLIEWWDPRTGLTAGAVASWLGRKNAYNFQQPVGAARPVFSSTALVGPTGALFPGLIWTNDGLFCSDAALLATIDALSSIDVYVVAQKSAITSLGAIIEYGVGSGWGIWTDYNDGVAHPDTVDFLSFPGGIGEWRTTALTVPLVDPGLLFGGFSLPGTGNTGTTSRQLDGVDMLGANVLTGSAATTYPSANLNLGARNGGASAPFDGIICDVLLYTTGSAAQRLQRGTWIANRYPNGIFYG